MACAVPDVDSRLIYLGSRGHSAQRAASLSKGNEHLVAEQSPPPDLRPYPRYYYLGWSSQTFTPYVVPRSFFVLESCVCSCLFILCLISPALPFTKQHNT